MNGHKIAKISSYSAARWRPGRGRFATEEMGMAVNLLQKQPARGPGRPFEKGRSGNPAGRPRGARNKATLAAEALFDSEAEALSRQAVELALGGSEGALRLCLDRLIAPRRERPIQLAVPPIRSASDIAAAKGAIVKAARPRTTPPHP